MAVFDRTRLSSSVTVIFAGAIAAALIVGATGGYLLRDFTSQPPGSAGPLQSHPANAAEQLPTWVQDYLEPAKSPQFKVDEMIRALDYQPTVRTEDLPAWVQRYMTPAEPPQFKVDEFIRSLS